MKDWEREIIEYRPPSPPKRELIGKGEEIAEEHIENKIDSLPPFIKDVFDYSLGKTGEEIEEALREINQMINDLCNCLRNDSNNGVHFEEYFKAKTKAPYELEPEERKAIDDYEWGHHLDKNGKPQVIALDRMLRYQKELNYYQSIINKKTNKKENESWYDYIQKEERQTKDIIKDMIDNKKSEDSEEVKKIASDTKIAYLMHYRTQNIMERTQEMKDTLQINMNQLCGFEVERFVLELGKSGKENVSKLKSIQEKSFKGSAYRVIGHLSTTNKQANFDIYEDIISKTLSLTDELNQMNSVVNWMNDLDDSHFEEHEPMGQLLNSVIDELEIATDGLNELHKDWLKLNFTAEAHERRLSELIKDKVKTQSFYQVLDLMENHYDFKNHSHEEVKKFIKTFDLDKEKNICGNYQNA
ncbi:MAG: hypothetical protein N2043_02335 [Ignavibacterium sp.]|nr:hypothetical protein [Ignavibacterium sp.]